MKSKKSRKIMKKKNAGEAPGFGAVFMSNRHTLKECLQERLFGLPAMFSDFVSQVRVGMILFLFEYEKRQLHCVFEATSDGENNIFPNAYKSSGSRFPAQVRVNRIWHCHPLEESEFCNVLRNNYYESKKFHFGLSKRQVRQLLNLFESKTATVLKNSSISVTGDNKQNSLTKVKELEGGRKNESQGSGTNPDGYNITESELGDFIPFSTYKVEDKERNSLRRKQELEEGEIIESECYRTKPDSHMKNESELGDFIPLPSSDDSDSEECEHVLGVSDLSVPVPRLVSDHSLPVPRLVSEGSLPAPQLTSLNTSEDKELNRSEIDIFTKGLYADAPNKRTSVFSRLIFSLKKIYKRQRKTQETAYRRNWSWEGITQFLK